jgi:hypothetical protein
MYCVMLWVSELHVIQHRIFLYTRSVCPVTGIVIHFDCFHVTVGSVPRIHFTVNLGPLVLVQCIAVNIRFFTHLFKESAGNVSFDSPGRVASNKHVIPCASNFITSESTGRD